MTQLAGKKYLTPGKTEHGGGRGSLRNEREKRTGPEWRCEKAVASGGKRKGKGQHGQSVLPSLFAKIKHNEWICAISSKVIWKKGRNTT